MRGSTASSFPPPWDLPSLNVPFCCSPLTCNRSAQWGSMQQGRGGRHRAAAASSPPSPGPGTPLPVPSGRGEKRSPLQAAAVLTDGQASSAKRKPVAHPVLRKQHARWASPEGRPSEGQGGKLNMHQARCSHRNRQL